MSQRVRRQHVVSQFYLKGFANDASRVKRLALPDAQEVVLSTADATVIKDFYTVELADGSPSDAFEQFFSQFEGAAAEAIRQVSEGTWPLDEESRSALASWIALQYLRGEEIRNGQGALTAFQIRLLVGVSGKEALRKLIEDREGTQLTGEELDWEWRDLTKPGGLDIVPDVDEHLALLLDMLPGLTAHLYSWHWTLIQFERRALGTADHPVSLIAGEDHPRWRGVGVANAALYYVPLTRRHGLTIQPRDRFPEALGFVPDVTAAGTTKMAQSLNQLAARSARRYVYCHPDEAPFADPVQLPEPSQHGWRDSGADGWIAEEGLFHALPTDHRPPHPSADAENEWDSDGMTLDDLPWPIPGRRASRPRPADS